MLEPWKIASGQKAVKVAPHDVAERLAVCLGHLVNVGFHMGGTALQVEARRLLVQLLVGIKRVSPIPFMFQVRKHAVADFPINAPREECFVNVCEEQFD